MKDEGKGDEHCRPWRHGSDPDLCRPGSAPEERKRLAMVKVEIR